MTGQPVGTPMYMAPEQALGNRATSAADVWALGALAYYAATGNYLFEGDHPAVVLYRVSAEEPSYDDCPEYLRPFLDACLVRDPGRRPSLDAILHSLGAPAPAGVTLPLVEPRRLSGAGRRTPRAGAHRDRRRRTMLVLGSVAAGTAVLAGGAFGVWSSLTGDEREPNGTGQTLITTPPPNSPSPVQPAADGSRDRPWAQGTVKHLDVGSCWITGVIGVDGRQATLKLACDQVGTSLYGNPTPSAHLDVYAVGQDGTTLPSEPADATAQDTFWTLGNLMDTNPVTVTVTLPDVGPLAAVEVRQSKYGYGWYWDATR
jgi:hypothetical protein